MNFLVNDISFIPTSALLNKVTIQTNSLPYVNIWEQVRPDTDLSLGNNISVYNLVLSWRRSWDSRSVQYHLGKGITADHIHSCVILLSVFFWCDATSPFYGYVISSWEMMFIIWSNQCGNYFNAYRGNLYWIYESLHGNNLMFQCYILNRRTIRFFKIVMHHEPFTYSPSPPMIHWNLPSMDPC